MKIRETSAFTRRRSDAARGLKPPIADINSRSTASPWEGEQLEKKLSKSKKHKKHHDDE